MRFRQIPIEQVDWAALDKYEDRTPEQRKPWLDYLTAVGAGKPVVAMLEDRGSELGWFTGMRKTIVGVPVLGSPLKGYNTTYMGLNLVPGVSRTQALRALSRFAIFDQKCAYLELSDVYCDPECARGAGYEVVSSGGFVTDLHLPEEELFNRMTSACRRCIRKAEKVGLVVEEAKPDGFAAEFHAQLTDVFAHQGLKPTYSEERVAKLIEHVHPSGELLLLRARTDSGQSIATGIFYGFGKYSGFWGNGSIRSMLQLRPNQAIHWYALRYWKARGVRWHHWGGGGEYKEAYGPDALSYCRQFKSAIPGLAKLRKPAIDTYYAIRTWHTRLRG
ncbi:MAG TPA: GNAT family N-acetyltransferase [Steroidobacter sp.]|uniref:GNAT family N-acetyltransferase n=1 Tax=Steroidobacter sp. TaxID=1978227 RepID=UPI002ED81516